MKQYITPEDIQQLSEKAQGNYLKYFAGRDGNELVGNISGKIIHPLASIGQMIEFLEEKAKIEIRSHYTSEPVIIGQKEGQPLYDITGDRIEVEDHLILCDALWLAVKQVLEVNNG